MSDRARERSAIDEGVQLQELDERHYVAVNVFERRHERGWSQEKLAEEAGMTQAQIARLEAGQANPTLRTLTKLAHTLGVPIYALATPPEIGVDFEPAWEFTPRFSEGVYDEAVVLRASEKPFTGDVAWSGNRAVFVSTTGDEKVAAKRGRRHAAGAAA